MAGIDTLLVKSLESAIYEKLGNEIISKIESRLFEKGYSLIQAIEEFDPFDKTLREFLGKEADEILLEIFNRIFEIKVDKNGYPKSFLIKDKDFINMVFLTHGNEEKKTILLSVSELALPISDILKKVNLPQSTCYRLVHSLIREGFLVETDEGAESMKRKVSLYKSSIPWFDIRIRKSIVEIEIHLTNEIIRSSRIIGATGFLFGKPKPLKHIP